MTKFKKRAKFKKIIEVYKPDIQFHILSQNKIDLKANRIKPETLKPDIYF